jgi:phosphate-selective porin OprO and OprP
LQYKRRIKLNWLVFVAILMVLIFLGVAHFSFCCRLSKHIVGAIKEGKRPLFDRPESGFEYENGETDFFENDFLRNEEIFMSNGVRESYEKSRNKDFVNDQKKEGVGMKKIAVFLVSAVFLFAALTAAHASEMQILVDKLVEKGILTSQEGQVLMSQAKEEAAKKEIKENTIKPFWKGNIGFESADGAFKTEIGGRIHADMLYMRGESKLTDVISTISAQDFNDNNASRAFFRRARLYNKGTLYNDFFYKAQFDFANSDVEFKDAYAGMKNIPYVGKFQVGQFKEPFSLEAMTSSNYITFLERALPNVFAPGRSWGAAVYNSWFENRLTFAIGGFRNTDDDQGDDMVRSNEWNLTTRITGLPWYQAKDKFLHLGAGYSFRLPTSNDDKQISFRQRPELRTRDRFVDTDNFRINLENRLGLEGAVVYGPFSIQGEFMHSFVEDPNGESKTGHFYGAYGYVSYFLTGESRKYSKSNGKFKGVKPKNNFSLKDRTWGAWEIAARYSHLDLNENAIRTADWRGGILNDITIGVNWYLNPNMRVMLNYVHANRNGVGSADGLQGRVQVTF